MSFETIYEKYLNGTATEEEKRFIEEEIAKARQLSKIIESTSIQRPVLAESDANEVQRVKKEYNKKTFFRTLLIVVLCIVLAAAASVGICFGIAVTSAQNSLTVSQEDAEQRALRFVGQNFSSDTYLVIEVERELEIVFPLTKSYYVYEVEIQKGVVATITVEVDSRDGTTTLEDVDY